MAFEIFKRRREVAKTPGVGGAAEHSSTESRIDTETADRPVSPEEMAAKGKEFIAEVEQKFGMQSYPVNPTEFSKLLRESLKEQPDPHELEYRKKGKQDRLAAHLYNVFGEKVDDFMGGGNLQIDKVPLIVKTDNQIYVIAFQFQTGNTEKVQSQEAQGHYVAGIAIYQLHPYNYFRPGNSRSNSEGLFLSGGQITNTVAPSILYSPSNPQVSGKDLIENWIPSFDRTNAELLKKDRFLSGKSPE